MMPKPISPGTILEFWYSKRVRERWFASTLVFDGEVRESFEVLWDSAVDGRLDDWAATPEGTLALVIVLDQLPLNMFRGEAKSFATEARAIEIAREAIDKGFDKALAGDTVSFLYMALMHSEDMADQERSVRLFRQAGLEKNIAFAEHHHDIIRRFGRFPHRNEILGRQSTDAERAYLASEAAFTG